MPGGQETQERTTPLSPPSPPSPLRAVLDSSARRPGTRLNVLSRELFPVQQALSKQTPQGSFDLQGFFLLWIFYRRKGADLAEDVMMLIACDSRFYRLARDLFRKQHSVLGTFERTFVDAVSLYNNSAKPQNPVTEALANFVAEDWINHPTHVNFADTAAFAILANSGSAIAYRALSCHLASRIDAPRRSLSSATQTFSIFQRFSEQLLGKTPSFEPLIRLKLIEIELGLLIKGDPAQVLTFITEYQQEGKLTSEHSLAQAFNHFITSFEATAKTVGSSTDYFFQLTYRELSLLIENLLAWAATHTQAAQTQTSLTCRHTLEMPRLT